MKRVRTCILVLSIAIIVASVFLIIANPLKESDEIDMDNIVEQVYSFFLISELTPVLTIAVFMLFYSLPSSCCGCLCCRITYIIILTVTLLTHIYVTYCYGYIAYGMHQIPAESEWSLEVKILVFLIQLLFPTVRVSYLIQGITLSASGIFIVSVVIDVIYIAFITLLCLNKKQKKDFERTL